MESCVQRLRGGEAFVAKHLLSSNKLITVEVRIE